MMNLAVRARELISSNVDALIDKASNPAKMLRLLLTELEENLIGLHGDLSTAQREHSRLVVQAEKVATDAEGWTAKAKVAVDHGREDLAHAALLARESGRKHAAELASESEGAAGKVGAIEAAIAELEAKREDVAARLKDATPSSATPAAGKSGKDDDRLSRRMDRLDAIERRVSFGGAEAPSEAEIEAEIAALAQESALEAELADMKKPAAKKAPRKKVR